MPFCDIMWTLNLPKYFELVLQKENTRQFEYDQQSFPSYEVLK